MNQQIVSISDLRQRKAPIVPSAGILVPGKTYFITGCDGAYLFITDYSSEGSPRSFVATKTAFDQMCTEGIKVDHVLDAGFLQPVQEKGQPVTKAELEEILKTQKTGDAQKDNDNNVQTKKEADIANDKELIKQIQSIFASEKPSVPVEKLVDIKNEPNPMGGDALPVSFTTFALFDGSLIPAQTGVFVWLAKFMLWSTLKDTHFKVSKNFMHEKVTKSSKMSFGLGLGLLSSGANAEAAEAKGPEIGKPVHENGKPKINSSGQPINFNFEWTKEWSRLTIKADVERLFEIGGYDTLRFKL